MSAEVNLISNLIAVGLVLFFFVIFVRMFIRGDRRSSYPPVRAGVGKNMAIWTRPNFLGAESYAREAAGYVPPEELRFRPQVVDEPVFNVASWVPITLLSLATLAIVAAGSVLGFHPALIALIVPALLALILMFASPSEI